MRRQYNNHNIISRHPGQGDAAAGVFGYRPPGWGRPDQERNVRSRSGRGWGSVITHIDHDKFFVNQHVVVKENGRFQLHGIIVSTANWVYYYHVRIMDGSGAIREYRFSDIRHVEDMAAGFGH